MERFKGSGIGCGICRCLFVAMASLFGACSLLHHGTTPSSAGTSPAAASKAAPAPQAGENQSAGLPAEDGSEPGANVQISYRHRDDYLASLSVYKFTGAVVLESENGADPGHSPTIVRFNGGVPVWEIKADTGLISKLPGLGSHKKFKIYHVHYGKLPKYFTQLLPNGGPPEPLETGRYYIFAVRRALGKTNYEALKVEDDGSLEGYDAEPRAGTSYALCCNLNADFGTPEASGGTP